jgi:hypothetical protein
VSGEIIRNQILQTSQARHQFEVLSFEVSSISTTRSLDFQTFLQPALRNAQPSFNEHKPLSERNDLA